MIKTLLRRLLYALILLGIISVLAFGLSQSVPGDTVLDYLSLDDSRYTTSSTALEQRLAYKRVAQRRGLDLPLFYLTLTPGYCPDTLFRIVPADDRHAVSAWIRRSKNSDAAMHLYKTMITGLSRVCPSVDTHGIAQRVCGSLGQWLQQADYLQIHADLATMQKEIGVNIHTNPAAAEALDLTNQAVERLIRDKPGLTPAQWWPSLRWHGTRNQYHQWMSGFVSLRPLTSLIDGRDAWSKIFDALKWTIWLNGLAFIVAIVAGVWIGIWSGTHDGSRADRIMHILLFALFALPSFWLATLLIAFFSSGEWLSVFPAGGLGPYHTAPTLVHRWGIILEHLTLPVICLAAGSLAYISRQMKQSVVHQLGQPYVFSLRTQGVSEKTIIRRHVIRNALFPLITLIGAALPALLSGSLIIEVIFSIPGMGRLLYTSLVARDWPVVFPILMMGATITVFSYILTDVAYKWADPRVKSMDA